MVCCLWFQKELCAPADGSALQARGGSASQTVRAGGPRTPETCRRQRALPESRPVLPAADHAQGRFGHAQLLPVPTRVRTQGKSQSGGVLFHFK